MAEEEAKKLSIASKGWRQVPVNPEVLGPLAKTTAPFIEQWLLEGSEEGTQFEATLIRLRRRIGDRARTILGENSNELYIASLSSRTVVYKGMVRSEILADFYKDLKNQKFEILTAHGCGIVESF